MKWPGAVETAPAIVRTAGLFELKDGKAIIAGNVDDCLRCESCVTVCPNGILTLQEM